MLLLHIGATALLVSFCKAQLFPNSSTSLNVVNTTLASTLANTTITSAPFLPSSIALLNHTNSTNGTINACQAAFDSWTTDWWWWVPTTNLEWLGTQTYEYDSTTYSTEIFDCTQTCGTICYAGPITTIISTTRISYERTATYAANPEYTVPRPNCTIGFDDCLSIQTSWSSAITSYSSMPLEYQVSVIEPPPPACSACISTACTFVGMFGMSLYYWPVTTSVSRDYCTSEPINGPNTAYVPDVNHTYVPITTGPYAVVDGITMYQGNIYVSYHEPRVRDNCGHLVTRQSPGHNVLTIASQDLHSIRKFPHALAPFPVIWDLVPWPVNYDDFNPPTPYSAYAGQRVCAQGGLDTASCTIVKPDEYFPYMLMPPQIRDLDANWKNCLYDKFAAFDPPIALHTREGMFSSVDAQPTSIRNAEPVQTPPIQPAPGQSGVDGAPAPTLAPGNPGPDPKPVENSLNSPSKPSARPHEPPANVPEPTNVGTPNAPANQQKPSITIGPSVIPIGPSGGLEIKPGLTLSNGGPPAVVDGTTVSVGPSGIVIVDTTGTRTVPMPDNARNVGQVITVGPSIIPIDQSGGLVIRPGVTMKIGDPALTIDGTVISVGPSGVILSDSSGISTVSILNNPVDPAQLITVGSSTYTMTNGQLILGPKLTISLSGAAVIMSGTTITLASEGIIIISSSRTSTIPIESKGAEIATQDLGPSQSAGTAEETGPTGSTAAAGVWVPPKLHALGLAINLIFLFIIGN